MKTNRVSRANPQVWRLAEWLCKELDVMSHAFPKYWEHDQGVRDYYYDKALELQRKLGDNEFTGPDSHGD